jgi:hypothetical protein
LYRLRAITRLARLARVFFDANGLGLASLSGRVTLRSSLIMFPQLPVLAGGPTPLLLVIIDLICALLTGGSTSQILNRERRRRLRRKAATAHYARCLEDFPELAAR